MVPFLTERRNSGILEKGNRAAEWDLGPHSHSEPLYESDPIHGPGLMGPSQDSQRQVYEQLTGGCNSD